MKKLMIILLLLSGMATVVSAQNLSQMSEKARNEKLVKEAKEAIKKYAPDYYRYTSGNYKVILSEVNVSTPYQRGIYCVQFIDYNREEESFREGYAVEVTFNEKDGSLETAGSGHGNFILISQEPLTRGQEAPKLEYKRQPPFKLSPDGTQKVY